MTEPTSAAPAASPPPNPTIPSPAAPPPGKSYGQVVAAEFLKNRPAVAAAGVVAALFAVAALAPFLANGLPYTIVIKGTVRHPIRGELAFPESGGRVWPLFAALTANELTVLWAAICALAAVVGWRRVPAALAADPDTRATYHRRVLASAAGVLAVGAGAAHALVPPSNDRPDWYRELLASGQAESAVYAPVPFGFREVDASRSYRSPVPTARFAVVREVRKSLGRSGLPDDAIAALEPLESRRFASADGLREALRTALPAPAFAEHAEVIVRAADTGGHLLGTDKSGGDVLARLIHGSRTSLAVGFVAVGISTAIGVLVGGLMGYFGGWVDIVLMRFMEIVMSIPTLILIITIVTFFPRDLFTIMAVIGLTTWPTVARFVRAEFLRLRRQDFVQAAVAMGAPTRIVMFRHMLPNGIAPVLVDATFGVGSAIFLEASLSFLGLGPGPDNPSWGAMLSESFSDSGLFLWWMSMLPGAAIFLTVLCYNLVGEGLRDAIDPRLRKAAS
jgi:ABC-type dipeptide/oligopeptide/nickel transport system permease subunit